MMLGSVFNRHQASCSDPSRVKLRIMTIGHENYPFSEFRGLGSPGLNLGQPGDIYIDITPGLHALYARYTESWLLWPGPNNVSNLLRHPLHRDRCLWCNTKVGWIHPRNVRVSSATASDLLSETLRCQEKLLEESKKRKRESLHQPIRDPPSFTANTSSGSPNRNSVESRTNQSRDALPFLSPTAPYSQPSHDLTISRTLTPTDASIIQNSDCTISPNTAHRRSTSTTMTDHMFTSDNLNDLSKRSPQERYNSPKRIDLRKVTFGDAKLRPFAPARTQRRRVSLPTHTKSDSYPTNEEQRLPQSSQPSIRDSESLRVFRNDDSPLGSAQALNSAAIFREPFVNNSGHQFFPVKPFPFDLSGITGEGFVTKLLQYSASVALTNSGLTADATQRSRIIYGLALDIAVAELRKIKDASDANAAHLQEANDKIHRLEAENAKLGTQLLNQCRNNSPSPLMITNVEMPTAAGSHALIGGEEVCKSREELTGSKKIVRHSPPRHGREEFESSLATKHLATPSESLLLAGTSMLAETASSVHALPPTESATVECRNTIDILNVKADTASGLSFDGCDSFESNMNICLPVKDVDSWHASPVPTSTLPRMREIHRSVLFAKTGTSLICRICLGTKFGGIEMMDQAFKTSEDSPELLQEHYEKEHPVDCEAVLNMSDEDLLDVVSMLSSEY